MTRAIFSLSLALLAACNTPPVNTSTPLTVQLAALPTEVLRVSLEVDGQTFPASIDPATRKAFVTVPNLAVGPHTFVARGFDRAEGGIVLYKTRQTVSVLPGAGLELKLYRLTSNLTVEASGIGPASEVLSAKAGGVEARLLPSGSTGRGTLVGVPTGRDLTVLVEGREGEVLRRQGSATFSLSEDDASVAVSLGAVSAQAPTAPTLTLPKAANQNTAVNLQVAVSDPNSGNGVQLKSLSVSWGDGSAAETRAVSGSSASETFSKTYTAFGPQTVTVTATNTAGLSAQASASLNIIQTANAGVGIDLGPELSSVSLSVTGVPSSAERVQAIVQPSTVLAQKVRPFDLKNRYELELLPKASGKWSGSLNLPQGLTYTLLFKVVQGAGETQSEASTFTPNAASFALEKAFGAAAACPVGATLTRIAQIQGARATSLLVGQAVTTEGVVTGDYQASGGLGGFFIQDPLGSPDPASSSGLFVFAATPAVNPGDLVRVSGRVSEFASAGDTAGTLTQISGVSGITVCGTGTTITPIQISLPVRNPADLERYEGMLVTFPQTLTVTEVFGLGRFGELVLSDSRRLFQPNNGNGLGESAGGNPLRRITLDDGKNAQNPNPTPYLSAPGPDGTRRVGDTVTGLTGVLSYGFGTYRIQPVGDVSFTSDAPRPAAPEEVGGNLRVASFNVLNYFTTLSGSFTPPGCPTALERRGANNDVEFARQKAKIVAALKGLNADAVGLIEMQNNGPAAVNDLVAALNAAVGDATYAAITDPETGVGCDAIKVAIIYKPAKLEPIGAAQSATDPIFERRPVAQRFRNLASEATFSLVVNHFKSKGCDGAAGADLDSAQGCWNAKRTQQAQALLSFLNTLKTTDPKLLVVGDLNAYGLEDPLKTLQAGGLENLTLRIPAEKRYSYVFGGESGNLDHALASSALSPQVAGIKEWHINADEPVVLDYNTEFKTDDRYAPTPYRSSDHDPVLLGLNLNP